MNWCMKGSLGNQNGLLMASLNTEYIVKNQFLKWVLRSKTDSSLYSCEILLICNQAS